MIVLGIDPGLADTGVAVVDVTNPRAPVVVATLTIRTEPETPLQERLTAIGGAFLHALRIQCPGLVAVEGYGWQGPQRTQNRNASILPRIVGLIEGIASGEGVPTINLERHQILFWACGSTKASKQDVAWALRARKVTGGRNDHERDAIAVALAGLAHHQMRERVRNAKEHSNLTPRDPVRSRKRHVKFSPARPRS